VPVSELGRVLRVDARRTAALIAVPVLAGLGVALAWRALIPGVAYWDNTVVAVSASVRLLGPVAATLAAWGAVREHRLDYLRSLTSRSPATGPLLDLLLLTVVALLAYGVVATVIVVETLLRAGSWDLRPTGLLAGAAALALHVVLGCLAGRLVPSPLVVVAVAVTTLLWAVLRADGSSWLSLLPPAAIGHVQLFAGLRPGVFTDQLLWSLGLGTTLVLSYVWTVSRRATIALPIAAALAVTTVSTVRLHGYGGAALAPAPIGYACSRWPLTVCVHPALRPALPSLEAAMTPLAARLADTPGAFTRVEQLRADDRVTIRGGVARMHLADLAPGYGHRAAEEIGLGLIDPQACADPDHLRSAVYSSMVRAWLLDERPPPVPEPAITRRFVRWGEQTRRNWFHAHYAGFRRCALRPHDFTG
jgi:hypothetical protein